MWAIHLETKLCTVLPYIFAVQLVVGLSFPSSHHQPCRKNIEKRCLDILYMLRPPLLLMRRGHTDKASTVTPQPPCLYVSSVCVILVATCPGASAHRNPHNKAKHHNIHKYATKPSHQLASTHTWHMNSLPLLLG